MQASTLHSQLLSQASQPPSGATLALAGVMASAAGRPPAYQAPIHGLRALHWHWLQAHYFPGVPLASALASAALGVYEDSALRASPADVPDGLDEFDDLVTLLTTHATPGQDPMLTTCLAHAIATACMGANHLWEDLGLPQRSVLGALMQTHFAPLKALNRQDMRWKKFFYRQLCEAAEVLICKSPSCAACTDRVHCFATADGVGGVRGDSSPAGAVSA